MNAFRSIAAVIVGYVVMAVWVMITLAVAWYALGHGFAFQGESLRVTLGWCLVTLVLGLIGAVIGGFVAALIAPRHTRAPVWVLAGLVLVAGLLVAVAHIAMEHPAPPENASPARLTMREAATYAVAPAWYDFLNPVIGVAGVLLGGALRPRRPLEAPAEPELD